MKNKSYSFTTEITPETEVLLSGRHGQRPHGLQLQPSYVASGGQ